MCARLKNCAPKGSQSRKAAEIDDFIVQNEVVVEVKSASSHDRVFDAQVLTYMRLTGLRTGLLLNFGRPVLKDGLKRFKL